MSPSPLPASKTAVAGPAFEGVASVTRALPQTTTTAEGPPPRLARVEASGAGETGPRTGTVNIANVIYNPALETLKLYDETPAEVANEAEVKKPTCVVYAWGH